MKVLIVKTSSLGDVVHALPAVTEAREKIAGLTIDWLVEEGFAAIPGRHPAVNEVITVAVRRWRKDWLGSWQEIGKVRRRLQAEQYDLVVDSQGLLKSGLLARMTGSPIHGFDRQSAREPLTSYLYRERHAVSQEQHAIYRQKELLASTFGYTPDREVNYGFKADIKQRKRIMLLHGTTWPSKEWPERYWAELAETVRRDGYEVCVPAGDPEERERAARILGGETGLLDRLSLGVLMEELESCAGVVSVDTGLGHLAPALGVPVVAIFGATDPGLTGVLGERSKIIASTHLPCVPCRKRECQYPKPNDSSNIYPPCYEQTSPESVWQALQLQIGSKDTNPR